MPRGALHHREEHSPRPGAQAHHGDPEQGRRRHGENTRERRRRSAPGSHARVATLRSGSLQAALTTDGPLEEGTATVRHGQPGGERGRSSGNPTQGVPQANTTT